MNHRFLALVLAAAVASPALARAEGRSPCDMVAEADRREQPFEDQVYHSKIQYREGGKTVRTFELSVTTKGMHKMLITFEAPGEVRGMRILTPEPGTMYVYHPEYRRVRRVASHVRNQGYMGTNLSYEDMTEHRYSDRWNCQPVKTTSSAWIVDLTPMPGTESGYSKLRVTIGRKRVRYERVEYYVGGRHVKSQIREDWREMEGLEMAGRVRFVSHDRDAEAIVEMTGWEVNTGVYDSAFTRRALLRGD